MVVSWEMLQDLPDTEFLLTYMHIVRRKVIDKEMQRLLTNPIASAQSAGRVSSLVAYEHLFRKILGDPAY